jgi:hypothetical protein
VKIFLVSLVIPGNVYPATENAFVPDSKSQTGYSDNPFGLKGKAPKTGYQSHYVLVNNFHPVSKVNGMDGDELVVFEGWQTFPLFLVYTSEFGKINSLANSVIKNEIPTEWRFLKTGDGGEVAERSVTSLIVGEGGDQEGGDGENGEDGEDGERDLEDYRGIIKALRKENKEMRDEVEKREEQARLNEDQRRQVAELARQVAEMARQIEELKLASKK